MNITSTRLAAPPQQQRPPRKAEPGSQQKCQDDHGFLTHAVDVVGNGTKFALQEGVLAAKNDPALAMRIAATAISDTILKKVDAPIVAGFDHTIVPVMRMALLGGNVVRARNTFTNPLSSTMEKAIDAGVVACDLVGAVGGVATLVNSQWAGAGNMMMGFSYAVDAITHAYRGLNHAEQRIAYWSNRKAEEQKKEGPAFT